MESNPESRAAGIPAGFFLMPRPQTMGGFALVITALAFIAGWLRNELALTLLGTVFLTVLVYCFLGVLFLGLLNRGKARLVSAAITSETVNAGKEGEVRVRISGETSPRKNRFFRLPAVLVRCEIHLETKDGRVIRHYACPEGNRGQVPGAGEYSRFPVKERGVYFSGARPGGGDKLVIFDAPGFFRVSLPLRRDENPRLFALPAPAEEPIRFALKPGGTARRSKPRYRKSGELTDHRPYVPGDDPRRINWKLYGHAPLGELFVREDEGEPPPHSRLLILIDTEIDRSLYSVDEGRRAVDILCENALAAARELSGQDMDILIGYTGGGISGGKEESGSLGAAGLASALAWPAAVFRPGAAADLPRAPRNGGVLILAAPRVSAAADASASALDRFLKNRGGAGAAEEADIVFLYDAEARQAAALEESARICVNLYNGKPGVHAARAAVSRGRQPR